MQLKAPHVLEVRRGGRAAEEHGEVLDGADVALLSLRRELADRHVFDHAPAQWAHCLVGHGDAPVLSEVVGTPRSQDRTLPSRYCVVVAPPAFLNAYRASGLVLWHECEVPERSLHVRCFRQSGRKTS